VGGLGRLRDLNAVFHGCEPNVLSLTYLAIPRKGLDRTLLIIILNNELLVPEANSYFKSAQISVL